jgi:hypothetical protein
VRLMSGIVTALAVASWLLFGVTFLAFVGLLAAGLGLTEHVDAVADGDLPSKGLATNPLRAAPKGATTPPSPP